ncbi:MAG: ADP-heptose:LPS heptosyltransferase [Candidatus Deianiraeaceae bacterium]|jgi:ADP-heptose:LPS heptosyltransferase
MKTLIFIGHDNIGDSFVVRNIIDTISHYVPNIEVLLYNKNSIKTAILFKNHPNIVSVKPLSTKIFSLNILKHTALLYKNILQKLKTDNVHITSLLGSRTVYNLLKPLLWWNRIFMHNKIIILHLQPLFDVTPIHTHLTQFHYQLFSNELEKEISEHNPYPLVKTLGICKVQQEQTIAILAGATKIWKVLSSQKFIKIAKYFSKKGFKIKLLGSNSKIDLSQAGDISSKAGDKIENLTGKTSITELLQEIYSASYVITNDSSAQHICRSFGVPCAVIWGRWEKSQTVKAYAWNEEKILNIFNEPYIFNNQNDDIGRKKDLISLNLETMPVEKIINKIERHIGQVL